MVTTTLRLHAARFAYTVKERVVARGCADDIVFCV